MLLPSDQLWDATTACCVEDLDDLPAGVDLPPEAGAAGFDAALDVATMQDVIANLLAID